MQIVTEADRGMATVTLTHPDPHEHRLQSLLERYECPVPFHVARARLLGAITSPETPVSPWDALVSLWGDKPPAFASTAQDVIGLLDEMWRCLARRAMAGEPFRVVEIEADATREELAQVALVRRQEIDGFVAGLFGQRDTVVLSKHATAALDSLGDIRALLQHLRNFLDDPSKSTTPAGLAASMSSVRELTRALEDAMNNVVRQCSGGQRKTPDRDAQPGRTLH
jgi:hypothetical protein